MKKVDHIHIRCPGNIGLLSSVCQIFFPKTKKTVKYAGNWDPKSKQPISYKIQKWILSNTFLTKNCKVLVYGKWNNQTKNIVPFFTASFYEDEIKILNDKKFNNTINFMFVGTLTKNKDPFKCVYIIEELTKKYKNIRLDIFGDGILKKKLLSYIKLKKLENYIFVHGNVNLETLKSYYIKNHFLLLFSKSEGWPKAIAEAMFFKNIPISTNVSCVNWMLDKGERGILINKNTDDILQGLIELIDNKQLFYKKSNNAYKWSRKYTKNKFEVEIKNLFNADYSGC